MKLTMNILLLLTLSSQANAFDLEDYATTFRATRDELMMAQTKFAHYKNRYDDFLNLLKANCKQVQDVNDLSKNLSGLMTGKCNRDGEESDPSGGTLSTSGNKKLGDLMARIIELSPSFTNLYKVSIIGNYSNLFYTLDNYRSNERDRKFNETLGLTDDVVVTNVSGCLRKDTSITKTGTTDEDLKWKYINYRADLYSRLRELKSATAPAIAAKRAYNAATSIYTRGINCSKPFGNIDRLKYDPFLPLNPWADNNNGFALKSEVNPLPEPTPEPTATPIVPEYGSDSKLVFMTAIAYDGNLGGICGADEKCNNDSNKPNGSNFKAMVVDGTNRINYSSDQGTDGRLDWVFQTGVSYFRSDYVYLGTASAGAVLRNLSNPFEPIDENNYHWQNYWTGIGSGNTWAGDNCNGWTQNYVSWIGSNYWRVGGRDVNVIVYYDTYNSGSSDCSDSKRLVCVEQ
jgi:hypothetical protein